MTKEEYEKLDKEDRQDLIDVYMYSYSLDYLGNDDNSDTPFDDFLKTYDLVEMIFSTGETLYSAKEINK